MSNSHAILGIVVVAGLFLQPFFGALHHLTYRVVHKRNNWTYPHIWLGRILITLGIINGGLGLQLAYQETAKKAAYAIVAALMWLAWMGFSVYAFGRRQQNGKAGGSDLELEKTRRMGRLETGASMAQREDVRRYA
jgi:RP/EB family microtubule-associated protein